MLQRMKPEDRKRVVPRVCVIGGKAAPGYDIAKRIIKLVSAVGDKINKDPDIGNLLKLVSRLLSLARSTRTRTVFPMRNTFHCLWGVSIEIRCTYSYVRMKDPAWPEYLGFLCRNVENSTE
jgi:hypothetical protein